MEITQAILSKKAKKGIFISTSNYPKGAYEFVASIEPKIVLIDGKELAELMVNAELLNFRGGYN